MIPISIAQAASDCGGSVLATPPADQISAVRSDTRQIQGGELFVAIKGERVAGASLAGAALAAGATAVLTDDPELALESGAAADRIIAVEDVLAAIGKLAKANLQRVRQVNPDLAVVAITGSVGKTTTKDLLAKLLSARGEIIAPPGSFNNELGLPLTVLRAGAQTQTLVLEMGADQIGNITYLTDIAPPNIGVVLAVAKAHLGAFGSIENVALAKSELVSGVLPGGTVILNGADERVRQMAAKARTQVRFFGGENSDMWASEVELDELARAHFTLRCAAASAPVTLGLAGIHHVSNALAAAAVARELGVELDEIATQLSGTAPASAHRMAVRQRNGVTFIDDSYNANPTSMRAALEAVAQIGKDRPKIAVLGAMLELGEQSQAEHDAIAEYAAQLGIRVISIGPHYPVASLTMDTAATELSSLLKPGDVVLLKGSNGSGVWRIAQALLGEDS